MGCAPTKPNQIAQKIETKPGEKKPEEAKKADGKPIKEAEDKKNSKKQFKVRVR